ncbi:MAG: glutamine-hydrolyzing GMP synthase, partial [Ignavibacterium sp.]|nr:glutamine-hydrolyzing GMP synthase [Ignavibacterium sp.]
RIRELRVFSELVPYDRAMEKIKEKKPKGLVFSGSPSSILSIFSDAKKIPTVNREILNLDIPVLGICYGMQLITHLMGGEVTGTGKNEYGKTNIDLNLNSPLFNGLDQSEICWMSHKDSVSKLPPAFKVIASTPSLPIAGVENPKKKIYGIQFHPEVIHTPSGMDILKNFLFDICGCSPSWTMVSIIENQVKEIRSKVRDGKVICGLSGGVDSTVAAVLVKKAIGENLICLHIDTGLMRKNESQKIQEVFDEKLALNHIHIDASELFISRLKNISDPEQKRKIIGSTFIEVFEQEAKKIKDVEFLVQGTLYPDVIESVSVKGSSVTIKSHHNVGGLPEKMNLKLIEPFRTLFKDEVRNVGRELNIPEEFIQRHPFPGPGLAVRVLGPVDKEKLEMLREADDIFIKSIIDSEIYNDIWQAFAVLLPVQSVGVMGDARTYEYVLALRAVTSVDGMTADWYYFEHDFLSNVSNKIINKVRGINRVVYDISSKPPATIEWE